MWFKQIQVFQILGKMPLESKLEEKFEQLEFEACRANTQMTAGWIAPIESEVEEYLVHGYKNYHLFCLQIEEKVLPAYVVRQELKTIIKEIETTEQRKVSNKEKYLIRDKIYNSLLPQAFSRITKVYAYFDVVNKILIVNTTSKKRIAIFTSMLQKTIDDIDISVFPLRDLPTIMTNWLQKDTCPKSFYIEDSGVLKKPNLASKYIRLKGHDLFSKSIQLFLIDDYKVNQVELSWKEQITFILKENFTLCTIRYADAVIAEARDSAETEEGKFIADFILMTGIINLLLNDLLKICVEKDSSKQ